MLTSVNHTWLILLSDLINISEVQSSRDGDTLELLGCQTRVLMNDPVVTVAARKLGRRFLSAEAAWILSGDNRVASIAPFSKEISRFSDDGLTFQGAYGPPYVDQIGYVVEALRKAPDTRQAVATVWRQRPGSSKDVPCTVALQWLYRDEKLHCVATMRSSDAWLGWVYDVHAFSAMSAHVLLSLRHVTRDNHRTTDADWANCQLGNLHLTAGSQHLYQRNLAGAEACLADPSVTDEPWQPLPLDELKHPDELVQLLWDRAEHQG